MAAAFVATLRLPETRDHSLIHAEQDSDPAAAPTPVER
jgi:hypothetical protein